MYFVLKVASYKTSRNECRKKTRPYSYKLHIFSEYLNVLEKN